MIIIAAFVSGVALGVVGAKQMLAQSTAAGYSTTMLFRTDLASLPGQEALVFAGNFAPGSALPMHFHPNGYEFTYVLEGEQTFHFEGGVVKTVKAGEVIFTPPNVPHYGQNATSKPSKTIVFRIKDKAQPVMVEVHK